MDAFPSDTAPRYLLRDRDGIYGAYFVRRVAGPGVEQVLTAPCSPWQSPYVERVIGSIRRECLDHAIVLTERHLRRILSEYVNYYRCWRTHLSLEKDALARRPVQSRSMGRVTAVPKLGVSIIIHALFAFVQFFEQIRELRMPLRDALGHFGVVASACVVGGLVMGSLTWWFRRKEG